MTADTPSGEAAKEAAYDIFLVISKRRGDQPTQEWLGHIASIIERHCPSPDIAGMRRALTEIASLRPTDIDVLPLDRAFATLRIITKIAREALANNERKP